MLGELTKRVGEVASRWWPGRSTTVATADAKSASRMARDAWVASAGLNARTSLDRLEKRVAMLKPESGTRYGGTEKALKDLDWAIRYAAPGQYVHVRKAVAQALAGGGPAAAIERDVMAELADMVGPDRLAPLGNQVHVLARDVIRIRAMAMLGEGGSATGDIFATSTPDAVDTFYDAVASGNAVVASRVLATAKAKGEVLARSR